MRKKISADEQRKMRITGPIFHKEIKVDINGTEKIFVLVLYVREDGALIYSTYSDRPPYIGNSRILKFKNGWVIYGTSHFLFHDIQIEWVKTDKGLSIYGKIYNYKGFNSAPNLISSFELLDPLDLKMIRATRESKARQFQKEIKTKRNQNEK